MNINLSAPVGFTGYGVAGLNILKALNKRGVKVSLFPTGQPHIDNQADVEVVQAAINGQATFGHTAPCLKIWHQFDLAQPIGRGKYFAYPFFELDKFNEREAHHIQFPDEVFVTCEWAKKVVAKYRDESTIKIVPLGIDPTIFNTESRQLKKRRNSFIVANFGKWEKRKGHDILVDIFNRAFTSKDNVELWMFPHNPFLDAAATKEWENKYTQSDLGHRIFIHPRVPNHKALSDLMYLADVGIFPSRGEGWNLELLEMMAMGKTCIATDYSAHSDYCDKYNSLLVPVHDTEPAQDGKWFFGQGNWASLGENQIEAFVTHLRACYKLWQEIPGALVNLNAKETGQRLTWDNTAGIILENLGR